MKDIDNLLKQFSETDLEFFTNEDGTLRVFDLLIASYQKERCSLLDIFS